MLILTLLFPSLAYKFFMRVNKMNHDLTIYFHCYINLPKDMNQSLFPLPFI